MKPFPKLNYPPVVEAVFCIDFAGLRPMTKMASAELMSIVSREYVWRGDMLSKSMTFDIKTNEASVTPVTMWEGSRFIKDRSNVVAISNLDAQIVRFSYSRLEPYESWDGFINEGKHLLNSFVEYQKADPIVKRVGVRFINHIAPPENQCPLADILYSIPPDPRDVAHIKSDGFFYKDTSYYADYDLRATSIKTTQRNPEGKLFVVVDTDVFALPGKEFSFVDWKSLLERSRELKNALFFGSISEKILRILRERLSDAH